jgi:hypothetical protein
MGSHVIICTCVQNERRGLTESVPENDAGEHGTLFDDTILNIIYVLAAATAGGVTLGATVAVHAFCSMDCTAQVVTVPSTTPTTTMSPLPWASVISTELRHENDEVEHGPLLKWHRRTVLS